MTTSFKIKRIKRYREATIGQFIMIDGRNKEHVICFTLEDKERKEKIYGSTCIPPGEYTIYPRPFGGFYQRTLKGGWMLDQFEQYGFAWIHQRGMPAGNDSIKLRERCFQENIDPPWKLCI